MVQYVQEGVNIISTGEFKAKTSILSDNRAINVFDGFQNDFRLYLCDAREDAKAPLAFVLAFFEILKNILFYHSLGNISNWKQQQCRDCRSCTENFWQRDLQGVRLTFPKGIGKGNFPSIWRSSVHPHFIVVCHIIIGYNTIPNRNKVFLPPLQLLVLMDPYLNDPHGIREISMTTRNLVPNGFLLEQLLLPSPTQWLNSFLSHDILRCAPRASHRWASKFPLLTPVVSSIPLRHGRHLHLHHR